MCRYSETKIPEGLHLQVLHSSSLGRQTAPSTKKWETIAHLVDTKNYVVATGKSQCSDLDNPNRKVGRAIAVGRALKDYQERLPHA